MLTVFATGAGTAAADTPSPTPVTAAAATDSDGGTVEDLILPVEDLVFGEANADGSLTDLGAELRLAADVLFAVDKADLSPRAMDLLRDAATRTARAHATTVTVSGHTDDQGSDDYNQTLSERRAQTVQAALQKLVGPSVVITAVGFGETRPIADNPTAQGRALNRRVEIRLR